MSHNMFLRRSLLSHMSAFILLELLVVAGACDLIRLYTPMAQACSGLDELRNSPQFQTVGVRRCWTGLEVGESEN